jgi:protein SMG6
MMGAINLGGVFGYGRVSGVIRRADGFGQRDGLSFGNAGIQVVVKRATTIVEDEESKMDVDDTGDIKPAVQALPTSELDDTQTGDQQPMSFKLAVQLQNPTSKASPFARATLNLYLTVVLVFLSTISKHATMLAILEQLT